MNMFKRASLILIVGGFMGITSSEASDHIWKGRAVLTVKKDKVSEFKEALAKIIEPTLKERGCISYEGYQVIDDNQKETNVFEFHELWKSKDAMMIDHKEKSAHMIQFFKDIKIDTPDSYIINFEVDGKWIKQMKGRLQ